VCGKIERTMPPFDQAFHSLGKPSPFLEFFHAYSTPEWWAAFALGVQAVILFLHWIILRRHAGAVEEHVGIAATQADTAKLIGQALEQQGKIMGDQLKIMADQFKFQTRGEIKDERQLVFDLVLEVRARLKGLASSIHLVGYAPTSANNAQIKSDRDKLGDTTLPCKKALTTSIHLPQKEKDYFLAYVEDVDRLELTNNPTTDAQQINKIDEKYKDFGEMILKAAQTPAEV
jgi:hypothetical protein